MKKNVLKYLAEFIIVAFGVFLGMYLNDRSTRNQLRENEQKALENIITELNHNHDVLMASIRYHTLIKESFDSLKQTIPEEAFHRPYFQNKGFKYVFIKGWWGSGLAAFDDTAFEVAKMSGTLQHMDIDLVQLLSQTYKAIAVQEEFQQSIQQRMMSISSQSSTYDAIGNVAILTGDNLAMEKSLATYLETNIERIGALSPTAD